MQKKISIILLILCLFTSNINVYAEETNKNTDEIITDVKENVEEVIEETPEIEEKTEPEIQIEVQEENENNDLQEIEKVNPSSVENIIPEVTTSIVQENTNVIIKSSTTIENIEEAENLIPEIENVEKTVELTSEIAIEEVKSEQITITDSNENIINTTEENITEIFTEEITETMPTITEPIDMEQLECICELSCKQKENLEIEINKTCEYCKIEGNICNGIEVQSNVFSLMRTVSQPVNNTNQLLNWDSLPSSYEYNWDNSSNCWDYGVWIDGVCYKTERGTYNTDVRHKMQLYCDGTYVYLHIIFSRDYYAKFNGEDYQFTINGNTAAFQVEWKGGGTITNNLNDVSPGLYEVEVRHRNSSMSYEVANGSKAYLTVNDGNINNQLELKIPLQELVRQNPSINLDTMSTLEFFTPNLMYRKIVSAGTSTYPLLLGLIALTISIAGFRYGKNKKYI